MKTLYIITLLFLSSIVYSQSDSLQVPEPIEIFKKASEDKLEIETTTAVHYSIKEIKARIEDFNNAIDNLRKEKAVWVDRLKKANELNVQEEPEKDGE